MTTPIVAVIAAYLAMGVAMLIAFGMRDGRDGLIRDHLGRHGRLPSQAFERVAMACLALIIIVTWPLDLRRPG
jgi:ABC-type Fe3+ transport system permease subunit